jgi:hypothetical protein
MLLQDAAAACSTADMATQKTLVYATDSFRIIARATCSGLASVSAWTHVDVGLGRLLCAQAPTAKQLTRHGRGQPLCQV